MLSQLLLFKKEKLTPNTILSQMTEDRIPVIVLDILRLPQVSKKCKIPQSTVNLGDLFEGSNRGAQLLTHFWPKCQSGTESSLTESTVSGRTHWHSKGGQGHLLSQPDQLNQSLKVNEVTDVTVRPHWPPQSSIWKEPRKDQERAKPTRCDHWRWLSKSHPLQSPPLHARTHLYLQTEFRLKTGLSYLRNANRRYSGKFEFYISNK